MNVDHVFEEQMYLISSQAVARNPLFRNKDHCIRFQEKLEKYLSPICEIVDYCLLNNQFQLIVRLRSRDEIIRYYRNKTGDEEIPQKYIPFTTHIFSQAMANLLSSTAIWFNRTYQRSGALFARRFSKTLINSEQALEAWRKQFHQLKAKHIYCGEWELSKSEQKQFSRIMGMEEGTTGGRLNWIICGKFLEENISIRHPIISAMKRVSEIDLEGQFRYIVPKSIYGYWNRLLSPVLRI